MTEQFINKSTLKDNYSVIPNNMLNDEGLDADCLAVMVYLLSKPSNWIVKPTNLQNRFKFGRDKAYRIINQLIKKQYIVREEHRVEGKYTSFTYYVYDSPFPCLSDTAEPYTANQYTTKYRKTLSKEKILMTDQLNDVKNNINMLNDSISTYDMKILEKEISNEQVRELGPLKYVAKSLGVEMDQVVNYFLLLIVCVFDPLAIALVIAANFAFAKGVDGGEIYRSLSGWTSVFSKRYYINKRV